jgi:hypothetical protein
MSIVLQVLAAWFYSHILEWLVHKHILHNRKLKTPFKNHFARHHRISRKNHMVDLPKNKNSTLDFEKKYLLYGSFLHLPLAFFFIYAYLTLLVCACSYYYIHQKAHGDIFWARKNVPWHYEHHLGLDQNSNWGVRLPMIDIITGTRKHFIDTPRERVIYISALNKSHRENRN